jgi:thioredoxin 1
MAFLSVKMELRVQKVAVDKRHYVLPSCYITGVRLMKGVAIVTIFRKFTIFLILSGLSVLIGPPATKADVERFSDVPVKGMVTMIDLGAKKCIPCKMMAPILAKMEKQYEGKAAIVFIDVWKHNEQARRFGIRAIPTQIFYNETGKEVYRHVGFMDEAAIINQLKNMGVE